LTDWHAEDPSDKRVGRPAPAPVIFYVQPSPVHATPLVGLDSGERYFMKTRIFLTLAVAVMLGGCSTPPNKEVYTYRNDLGPGIDLIKDNELDSGKDPTELVWLNASRVREGAWGGKFYLEVRYEGAPSVGYLDIGPGQTLELIINGNHKQFKGMGSLNTREITSEKTYVENALYPATANDFRELGKARTVEVRITGKSRTVYRAFTPENVQKFNNFVLSFVGY
jgi:hypothetical protein